ncbi:hypothetical protein BJV78DRAFT_1129450 [Lactifluus subvellereus]|nr:hypothetical protein BJV78DRAFT_1129450 [Lactifluus subvellereus]
MLSESKAKAKAPSHPLSLEDTLRDLAVLRTSDIDLAAILTSTMPAPSAVSPTAMDASIAHSYEFVEAARAAIKINNRGDVEAQGERVNDVRGKLEDVLEGLRGSGQGNNPDT